MYARVRTYQIKEGEIEKRLQHGRGTAVPAAAKLNGSKGVMILVDPVSHKNVTISLWETEEDMLALDRDEQMMNQLSHKSHAAGDVTTEYFQVAHQE
jgi:hypothetical protein